MRFGYDLEHPVISDFSARVGEGQTVALVGPTGAGKTTMVKLLMRFYDVDGGAIRIGGHDVREFSREDVRSQFGMVLQDTWLYNATVRENIRYGRLDATDAEVEAAAKAAFADHFIRTLPEGYDTVINEDASNISQGQRQLLTIARAILADRRMLILDEANKLGRHAPRGAHPGGYGQPHARAHVVRHRSSLVDHSQCRFNSRFAKR